jgi:EAL domain-containing protein (putative c-di-GMP-specific phosphodiesterase class I)
VSSSFATQQAADADTWGHVEDLLELARRHLGMELAWLSEFSDGRQMIRVASGDAAGMNVNVGSGSCLEDSYCARVLAGTLPATIPDARRNLVTRGLAVTHELGIGSYVGVPWHGSDGEPAGMLCCLSPGTSPGLDERAARFLAAIAEVVSNRVTGSLTQRRRAGVTDHIQTILQQRQVRMVFQPVVRLRDGAVLSYEALARFDDPVFPTPAHAFAAATHVGLGVELEHLAVREALAQLDDVPDSCFLAVNLSAEAMIDPEVQRTLLTHAGRRIGVELTEHVRVADYTELVAGAERLRSAGIQLAVDDAGAGFASFSHILRLRPDVIKLDIDLTRDVDTDPVRQALTRALVDFSRDIGAHLIAEGIETQAEHDVLLGLGVLLGQGFLIARPAEFPAEHRGDGAGHGTRPRGARITTPR